MNLLRFWTTDSRDANSLPLRTASLYNNQLQPRYYGIHDTQIEKHYMNSATGDIWLDVDRGDKWFQSEEGLVDNWLPAYFTKPKTVKTTVTNKSPPKRYTKPPLQHPKPIQYKQIFVYAPYALNTRLTHSTNTAQY